MTEWATARLGELATHIKDGTHGTHKRVETGIPFLSAKNIGADGKLTWDESDDLISNSEFAAITSVFQPRRDDLLLTIVGSVGRSALFDGSAVAFQRSVAFVRPGPQVLPAFLHHASQSVQFTRQLDRRSNVTAQAGLYLGELAKVEIPLPPKDVQQCISAVLTSLDNAIEATEALIDKHQQIKAGLMHDLFTRGISTTGQIGPRGEGLPIGWRWTPLGEMARVVGGVTLGGAGPANGVVVPYLRVANVQDGYLALEEVKTIRVSRLVLEELRLLPGDVLMNEGGDFDKLGRGTVWSGEIDDCVHQNHVFRVRTNRSVLHPDYLALHSESHYGKRYFLVSSKQSTNLASINATQLRRYPIALPPLDEQARIVARLSTAKAHLSGLERSVAKLRTQKLGLMQDLLTGKVRVKVPEPTIPA
jgi:type I restriction enzyme, S subunit